MRKFFFDKRFLDGMRGFTLVELLVVIGIIAFISVVIFANFPKLSKDIYISRAAREFALSLRDMQVRSSSILEDPLRAGKFPNAYGVHLKKGKAVYQLFIDVPRNPNVPECYQRYNPEDTTDCPNEEDNELVKSLKFTRDIYISDIIDPTGGSQSDLNILYYRPSPTTVITSNNVPGRLSDSLIGPFSVVIAPRNGLVSDRKTVKIWITGQISIQ